jgi:gamma-glutamyltranspeptidase
MTRATERIVSTRRVGARQERTCDDLQVKEASRFTYRNVTVNETYSSRSEVERRARTLARHSLADTEFSKNRVEDLLGADYTGDRAERFGGQRNINRDDFRRHHRVKRESGAV